MPKTAHIAAPISASSAPPTQETASEQSEGHPLVSIALFCGVGLLISLISVLMGVQGAWY